MFSVGWGAPGGSGPLPNRRSPERGARGGRPRGQHDEWPQARAFRGQGQPRTLVELRGFEPLTPSMRTRCATGLRYSPEERRTG